MKDDVESGPSPGRLFLTVFPSIMLPMFLAVVDHTTVPTTLPAISLPLCTHPGRAGLRPAARRLQRPAHDVRGAVDLPRRIAVLRRRHQHRDAGGRAHPAGARRWRPDDAVAGADRRGHPAARAGAL